MACHNHNIECYIAIMNMTIILHINNSKSTLDNSYKCCTYMYVIIAVKLIALTSTYLCLQVIVIINDIIKY